MTTILSEQTFIFITDTEFGILQCSAAAAQWLEQLIPGCEGDLQAVPAIAQNIDNIRFALANGEQSSLTFSAAGRQYHAVCSAVGDWIQVQIHPSELMLTNEDYKKALEVSTNAIIILHPVFDESGKIVNFVFRYGNPAYLKFKGIAGCAGIPVFSGDVLSSNHFHIFRSVVETGAKQSYEFEYEFEGAVHVFAARVMKMGEGLLVASEDISDRKHALTESRQNSEFIQSVFDTNLVQMSVMKAVRNESGDIVDFQITLVNQEVVRETGRADLVGKLYVQEYPGVKRTRIFEQMVQVVETGVPIQDEYYYPYEGFNKWYSCMFVKFHDGVVATNLDITQRKHAEEELYKNFSLLQYAEELAHSGSWEYDIVRSSFTWSAGMYELFDVPEGMHIRPSSLLRLVVPQDREKAADFIHNLREVHQDSEHTFQVVHKGTIKSVRASSRVERNHKGAPVKVLGIVMDITAALRAEKELRELNAMLREQNRTLEIKNNELASFAFIASHDLKEPLRKIMFFSNLLRSGNDIGTMSPKGQLYLERMETSARRMSFLIDDVLALSRLQVYRDENEWADMTAVIDEVCTELSEDIAQAGAEIRYDHLPKVFSSTKYLQYLFNNLLGNALKFRHPDRKPEISVTASEEQHSLDERGMRSFHVVRVADNGIGFEPEFNEKIFRIFERLHTQEEYPGSGIGLSICRKIMENLGGSIRASGYPGEGALFTCYFPVR
ncbi:MAG: ATP-binding protein [Chitinophagaceae bacterium]